jgi:hypothetical protein
MVSSESKRKSGSSVEEHPVIKDQDDSFLTLSLGFTSTDDCSPVTPTMAAPLRPENVSVSLPPPPPPGTALGLGLVASVVHGDGHAAAAFVPAAAGGLLAPTTLPLFPPRVPSSDGTGAFAVASPVPGIGAAPPARTTSTCHLPSSATSPPPAQGASASPKKRRRVITSHAKPGGGAAPINNGDLVAESAPPPPPPFPWAKPNRVAEHYSLAELAGRGITAIEGEVQCRRCDARTTLSLDLATKFRELHDFVARNVETMNDRAPEEWKDPALPDCDRCGQRSSLRPVIAAEKEQINWLFLLLGQTLGLCTLEQLKHFCAHTNQHRTGAKDRVLYSTYMELCNQLCPGGPFDMASERKSRVRSFV